MPEDLGVLPTDLRGAAKNLADVSARIKAVMNDLHQKLAAEGRPWGDDEIGRSFSEGASGYLAQMDWVDGSVKAKTDLLDAYANDTRTAANTLEQGDEG